jgi:hypothetical protein
LRHDALLDELLEGGVIHVYLLKWGLGRAILYSTSWMTPLTSTYVTSHHIELSDSAAKRQEAMLQGPYKIPPSICSYVK